MNRQEAFHNAIEYVPRDPRQSRLYMTTIFVQALVAWLVRLPIVYFLLTTANWFIPVELNVPLLAALIVFGPIAWSLATFAFPGGGWLWCRYIGAREPSKRETDAILESFAAIGEEDFAKGLNIQVFPHPVLFAFARGRALVYSSALVRSDDYLTAATAHEVAHLKSSDAILTQALDRFVLWGDPLPVFEGMNFLTVRSMVLRLLSGRLVLQVLKPMWADYFREREREADEFVVRLGLGHQLAELIETWELPKEVPNPRIAFNMRDYLDPELRIEILTEEEEDDFADEPGEAGGPANESEEEAKMRRIWAHIEDPGSWPDRPSGPADAGGHAEPEDTALEPEDTAPPPEDSDEPGGAEELQEEPEDPVGSEEPAGESEDRGDPPADPPKTKPADPPKKKPADPPKKKPAGPPKKKRGSAKRPDGPPPEVSDPRDRWADLLVEGDGPLEEPDEMPDSSLEELDELPDEAEGLEGPPR